MTRGLSSDITTELSNQSIKTIALVEILFPTPQRLTNHYKEISHNSNTYSPSGHLLSISGKGENSTIDVSSFQIELSAVDSAFVSIVLNNVVNNDKVTVDIGFLDDTDYLIDTFTYEVGYIDSFNINTKTGILILNCTSQFADFSRTAGRKTNNGSQQRYFNTDVGFEFAGLTVKDLLWGRK